MFFKTIEQQTSTLTGLTLMLICTAVILQSISSESVEARYLPTRADESDVEVLKNIIKGVSIKLYYNIFHSFHFRATLTISSPL